jgi:hypothetical protein
VINALKFAIEEIEASYQYFDHTGAASATANSSVLNGGPATATAVGGNGGALEYGSGGAGSGGAANANASATNGGPAIATAVGGNGGAALGGGFANGGNGGLAGATATSTAMLGGAATRPQQRQVAMEGPDILLALLVPQTPIHSLRR